MDDNDLIDAARRAGKTAYCEYSDFPVGAALLADDGRLFTGCNVENASYGLSICAERAAVFAAVAAGVRKIQKMAVSCSKGDKSRPETLMPCGACRQVLAEFATPDFVILVDGVGQLSMPQILPQPFQS